MENEKDCNKLLNDIIKELDKTKHNSIEISNKLHCQAENIEKIQDNLDEISHQADVSKWQLNYIESTFGKIYRKIHNYPIKENASNFAKLLNIKTRLIGVNFLKNNIINEVKEVKEENTLLDTAEKLINDIKEINRLNNNEISKHNIILDYNNQMTENSSYKISNNTKKINKLLD